MLLWFFSIPAYVQTDVNDRGQVIFVQKVCFASRTLVVIRVDANNSMLIPFNATVLILSKEIDVNLGDVKRGRAWIGANAAIYLSQMNLDSVGYWYFYLTGKIILLQITNAYALWTIMVQTVKYTLVKALVWQEHLLQSSRYFSQHFFQLFLQSVSSESAISLRRFLSHQKLVSKTSLRLTQK